MSFKIRNFFKFKTMPLSLSFDTLNSEVSEITSQSQHSGLKYEISKTIAPFLQLTAISFYNKPTKTSQYFSTVLLPNSVFQFCIDSNRSYQLKSSFATGPISTKFFTIISSKKEVYSQIDSLYRSLFYNIGVRLINPTFHASNLIYILNYCQAIGSCCIGLEAVGVENQLGISVAGRMEKNKAICYFSLQRFNEITVSFYRKIYKSLELGFQVKKSKEAFSSVGGIRLRSYRNEIKASVDQSLRFGFQWNEKLTENLSFEFNCGYDEEFDYGLGLNFEG